MLKRHSILLFVVITLALSYAVYFTPLPAEQKSLLVPVLLVVVPTVVCIPLAFLAEGMDGIRQLFSSVRGAWKWVLIGAAAGVLLRVAVLIVGLVLGTNIRMELSSPGAVFIILGAIPFAWFEELGWRRFALDRMLRSRSPIESALILGLPWGIVHLILVLPGMMQVGAPAIPQTIMLLALGIFITWVYVRSGGSLLATTFLHGVQNGFIVINRGLGMAEATWLMMGVYVVLAILLVIFDRRTFFARPTAA